MAIHVLGIRHHGPGSARHLKKALDLLQPDILLVEGPPEAESILSWTVSEEMKPPVAILAYVPDAPHRAVFYPFTNYSPEWQAILYGLKNSIPVRFIDMPLIHKLAEPTETDARETTASEEDVAVYEGGSMQPLSDISGYEDSEVWWEQHFELSDEEPLELFKVVADSVKALREHKPVTDIHEQRREAFMRMYIRKVENEMYQNVVVVCGAWHTSALMQFPTLKEDQELLKKLPKAKVECTWIPWTNRRLMIESGYGAGIKSAGWYQHQWEHPEDDGSLWLSMVARTFRNHDKDISSAHIIEAVRLIESLRYLRGLRKPGLAEYNEAIQTVMCMGDAEPLLLIEKELIVGNLVGSIPPDAPLSPLQRDFESQVSRLRIKIAEGEVMLLLDLRNDNDLNKSILLHRLQLLGVKWGSKQGTSGKGTFKEAWRLYWEPELMLDLIDKSAKGNTILQASNNYVVELAENSQDLRNISELLKQAIPSELENGTQALLKKMDVLAASSSDTQLLLESLIPLADVLKYGNVRKTDQVMIAEIFKAIFYRMLVGLPLSCCGIDENAAQDISHLLQSFNTSLLTLDQDEYKVEWNQTILKIKNSDQTAPFIGGVTLRMLYDFKVIDPTETALDFSKALSVGNEVTYSAQWMEGFLKDAATVLLLDENIWQVVQQWIQDLDEQSFLDQLPILRRTFSNFNKAEKQKIAAKAKKGDIPSVSLWLKTEINEERAKKTLPVLKLLLGLNQ